ncbi:hypothetical protein V2J09_010244 [Rumex salicifolius]
MKREMKKGKRESVLRFIATCLLLLVACLIRTNSQTKILFDVLEKKATYRDVYIFVVEFYVVCVAAGYSFLQMLRCLFMSDLEEDANLTFLNHILLATTFLLDQTVVYIVFAMNVAATMASTFAVVGNESLQWDKLCNMYTRFCYHVGAYLILGFAASLLLAYISSLSSFFLFRLYSPSQFLRRKRQSLDNAF